MLVGSDDGVRIWQNGKAIWTNDVKRGALPFQDAIFLDLEPGSNDFLFRIHNDAGESGLYLHYRSLHDVAPQLPEPLDGANLAARLASAAKAGNQAAISPEFLNVDWIQATAQGDREQGRKLFEAAGCIKCHAILANAAAVGGPSLADADKRFTIPYLVESILTPSKQISPVFRATQVITDDGRQFSGLVVGETAEQLDLLLSDTKRATIAKASIERREMLDLSPMPQGLVKQTDELKHLLAFLMQTGK